MQGFILNVDFMFQNNNFIPNGIFKIIFLKKTNV